MSNQPISFDKPRIVRTCITVAVLVALYLLIKRLSGVLLPFLISFVVAYMLAPIVDFFQKTRLPGGKSCILKAWASFCTETELLQQKRTW